MSTKCEGCRHVHTLHVADYCYLFEKQPEELPCGQHDKYKEMRRATGRRIRRNPFLMHLLATEHFSTKKPSERVFFYKGEDGH